MTFKILIGLHSVKSRRLLLPTILILIQYHGFAPFNKVALLARVDAWRREVPCLLGDILVQLIIKKLFL